MKQRKGSKQILFLVLTTIWIVFTVSLVSWWVYFGFTQVDRLMAFESESTSHLVKYQKMLIWEGLAMVFCLVAGGGVIFYFIRKELKESERLKLFFSTLSHDIKRSNH